MKSKFIMMAAVLFAALGAMAGELKFDCLVSPENGICKAGEKFTFAVKLLEDGKIASGRKIRYQVWRDNEVVVAEVTDSMEISYSASFGKPAWYFIQVWAVDGNNKIIRQEVKKGRKMVMENVQSGIGVLIAPEKFLPVLPEPADFDAFWDKVKQEVAAVPMKEIEKVRLPDKDVQAYDIKISCAGDKPVSGYLCLPNGAKPKSCPAFVSFHGAGVRSAYKNVPMARRGVIALDINAHGIENGKPWEFYQDLYKNYYYVYHDKFRPRRYAFWNKHDRDLYYFKGVYMRLLRALEYVKSLPEWDGKHLIVSGGSQGGAQVLFAAAMDKDVTFARAGVPALCDHSGSVGGRRSGWPGLYTAEEYKTHPEYSKCAAYYDGAYFAGRIRCPIYINTGFMDTTCPPSSVFAAYNSIPKGVEKYMQVAPEGIHSTPHTEGLEAMYKYIDSIVKK